MPLIVKTIPVCEYQQNARVLLDTHTKKAVIIDPGGEAEKLYSATEDYIIDKIILTHCHLDHAGGVVDLLEIIKDENHPSPELYWHSKDTPLSENIEKVAERYGFSGYKNPPPATQWLDNISSISIGSYTAQCLFTPGHAPGHVALFMPYVDSILQDNPINEAPLLFAGDALFKGSIGRTDLPFGDTKTLLSSIKTQLFPLPNTTLILSGHGPNTTLKEEKEHNPFLKFL